MATITVLVLPSNGDHPLLSNMLYCDWLKFPQQGLADPMAGVGIWTIRLTKNAMLVECILIYMHDVPCRAHNNDECWFSNRNFVPVCIMLRSQVQAVFWELLLKNNNWVAPYYGCSLSPWGKQPKFPVHCIGTRKLSNLI